ncbi:HAMP domain-containing sensor histidine kinase [uncultured Aeromicrobium sp.]|uniref:sensor histidine kinase n=1 Tax=uncultured Aeromicrobium sp. TaxID=337820 RepID=UPI0025D9B735|nr:HAMP domain-containing sensor histidine kinase [uncultured Aeromicrobium sp.]
MATTPVIVLAVREPATHAYPAIVAALALLAGTVVAAFAVPWDRIDRRWTFWLAFSQLLIAVILASAFYSTNNAIPLLAVIPVLWIAFQLDWRHTIAMVIALVAGNIVFLLTADPLPNVFRAVAACAIFTFVVASLAVVTQANVQALRASRATAESALAEAESNAAALRAIADAVDASVMFTAQDRSFTFTNPQARAWGVKMGIDPDNQQWAGDHVYAPDRITPIPADQQLIPRALDADFVTGQLMWIGPPGDQIAVSTSSLPAITAQGTQIGTVVVGHDITGLLEALNAAESFSATVAHELRTPLTAAVGYLDLLDDTDELSPANRAFLERARQGVVALSERLRELLEPFEVAAVTPSLAFVDLVSLVDSRIAHWRATAAERQISIVTSPPCEVLRVPIDQNLVARMLDAVLSNAVKFSEHHGVIEVSVRRTPTHALVVVKDHGFGMTKEEQRHAFERFYRAPTAIRRALPGFGLGLGAAQSIAAAHAGTITLDSEPGHGTTVTIELSLSLAGADRLPPPGRG